MSKTRECLEDIKKSIDDLTAEVHEMNRLSYVTVRMFANSMGMVPDQVPDIVDSLLDEYDKSLKK